MTAERLLRLRERMAERDLPALLVADATNRYYLSGFSGSAGALFITPTTAALLTDFRYVEQATEQAPDFDIVRLKESFAEALGELVSGAGLEALGFESAHVTYAAYQSWTEKLPDFTLVPTQGLVEGLRMVKDAAEIELIRQAVRITDGAYEHLKSFIRPGMTEKEVAWELEIWMRTHGADGMAFPIIVACGARGAMPHARASDARIEEGVPIVVDMGAKVDGYNADMTRTFCLGSAEEQFNRIFDIVLHAQETAERNLVPGMGGNAADALARELIAAEGYGEQFGHGLGHGVGLEVHEAPYLGARSESVLETGCVNSAEPGIYLPGWGGVRIEDLVLITESGAEVLTQSPKDRFVPVPA